MPTQMAEDDTEKDALVQVVLLRPWFDFKGRVDDAVGFQFSANYNVLYLGATTSLPGQPDQAAGGVLEINGNWTLVNRRSSDKGVLGFRLETRHKYTDIAPNQLGAAIGSVWKPDVLWGEFDFAVSQLWWEQRFMAGKGAVRFGKLITPAVLYDNFFLRVPQLAFENETLIFSSTAFPSNGLGVVGVVFPIDRLYLQAGLHDANGSPTEAGFDTFFDDAEFFTAVEVGYTPAFDRRRLDNYHVTVWHADARRAAGLPSGWGLTIAFQRYLNERLMPWLRYSYSDGGLTPIDNLVTAGMAFRTQGHNGFGVGLLWGSPSDSSLRNQFGVESLFRVYVAQTLSVIPGLQLIFNPSRNPDKDFVAVFSARARLSI